MWVRRRERMAATARSELFLALAAVVVLAILAFDAATPADNVSVCFAYTLPILLGVYASSGSSYRIAVACTLASLAGSFVSPPHEGIAISFVANRLIAVVAQWLVAFLIEQRRLARLAVEARLGEEEREAEMGRRFLQILTHEIATALTSIDGQGYRLAKLAPTLSATDIAVRAGKIRRGVARLDALVSRVRLAAEVGDRRLAPACTPLDAAALLMPLCAEYEDARVSVEVRPPEPALFGDPGLIYQAVANLVSNAVKYSARPAEVAVVVDRSCLLDGAVVVVSDRGIGIDPAELGRVFEPYYRTGNSGGVPGIGVGLHLVRGFVEAHGGRVGIESAPDAGTIVRLHLPGPIRA